MASKYQFYAELSYNQTHKVASSIDNWTGFLKSAGRLYKYPFEEQVMIHAQRPDAVACAPLEIWNKPMNRYVRKGSKGIALLDESSGKPRLKYVFDVMDTNDGWRNLADGLRPKRPFLWEMKEEHKAVVLETIKNSYNFESIDGDVGALLFGLAETLSARYYVDNKSDIHYSTEGSFLEDYDEDNISVTFKNALTISTAYTLMSRCGVDPSEYIEDEDFHSLMDFNTMSSINTLGEAISNVSEEVLREIETTIKTYERGKINERNNVPTGRGLSSTEHRDRGNDRIPNEIRHDEEELSEHAPPDNLRQSEPTGETVPTLPRNRENSQREVGLDDKPIGAQKPTTRQSERPDGLGTTHEHVASTGGGNHTERANLQLNETQIEQPSTSDVGGFSMPENKITDEEIDKFLIGRSSVQNGKYRIYSFFLHEHTAKEKADFLKDEYGTGGRTHAIQGENYSYADYDSKGLELKKGDIIAPIAEIKLTWANVANRIDRLIADGLYMSQNQLDYLPIYENRMLGAGIINFYRNLPKDITRPFPDEYDTFMDYWESAGKIGEMLDNPQNVAEFLSFMQPIMENTPESDRNYKVRKNAFDNMQACENGTFTLFPRLEVVPDVPMQISFFPTESEQIQLIQENMAVITITKEDIANAICNWNGNTESKIFVYDYMQENARSRHAADFLKGEYGGNLPDFIVTKDGAEPIIMPWSKVQRRLVQLIDEGKFLTSDEQVLQQEPLPEPHESDLLPNQHIENIGGVEFVFTNIVPTSRDIIKPKIAEEPEVRLPTQTPVNFRITDDNLGIGNPKIKAANNIIAIRTLKQIESENRLATAEEQETPSKYVGWGGISEIFDAKNTSWVDGYKELKNLLTSAEFDSARASTLNAHYTSPTIIKAMYSTVERLGFKNGNILEPSCGVGNFFGLLPQSMQNAKLYGVELDNVTGKIAKQLYQNADIKIQGFEKTNMPDSFFDVAIGNVPFGSYKVVDRKYNKQNFLIHDYFFGKTLDQVRPGGIVAFVTSKGTLDKQNPEVRKYIAQRADLLGAVRLPNNAFKANAGTEVTSDIIFLQKRDSMLDIQPDWVHLGKTENDITVNSYFAENPHMILGEMAIESTQYGFDTTCKPIEGADFADQLKW